MMIEKKFKCGVCGQEHTVKLKEDYDEGDFIAICPETGKGVYVVIEK